MGLSPLEIAGWGYRLIVLDIIYYICYIQYARCLLRAKEKS